MADTADDMAAMAARERVGKIMFDRLVDISQMDIENGCLGMCIDFVLEGKSAKARGEKGELF